MALQASGAGGKCKMSDSERPGRSNAKNRLPHAPARVRRAAVEVLTVQPPPGNALSPTGFIFIVLPLIFSPLVRFPIE